MDIGAKGLDCAVKRLLKHKRFIGGCFYSEGCCNVAFREKSQTFAGFNNGFRYILGNIVGNEHSNSDKCKADSKTNADVKQYACNDLIVVTAYCDSPAISTINRHVISEHSVASVGVGDRSLTV